MPRQFIHIAAGFGITALLWGGLPTQISAAPHSNGACTPLAPSADVRFAVIGDYGYASQPEDDVATEVASWSPDLILTVGDNSYPSATDSTTVDNNIGQYYHDFICPYSGIPAGSTTNRFFPALGNHDWAGPTGAQPYFDYFTLPGNERYYDFIQGPVHFFVVDSDVNEPDGISAGSTQALWLQAALAASTSPWDLVFLHHAPYSSASVHGSSPTLQWPYRQWGADAVFAGHDHTYERLLVGGMPYFVDGLGGYTKYGFGTPLPGSQVRYSNDFGAMRVDATAASIRFQFITRTGLQIDDYTLTKPVVPLDQISLAFESLVGGLSSPVDIENAADGTNRLFIVEQTGKIRIVQFGALLPTPFLDLSTIPIAFKCCGEQGLLAMAFHPDYATNGKFYILYTAPKTSPPPDSTGADLVVEQFTVSAADPNVADPTSGSIILSIPHPVNTNHNGGTLAFGPDGYLYWSTGDGGGGGDPDENAQDRTRWLGKLLRLDVDSAAPYAIPADNPYVGNSDGYHEEIWAFGLRNPWRLSFDRLTGDLLIGDVGQGSWEEVDFQPAGSAGGQNYGWDMYEGDAEYNPPYEGPYDPTGKTFPVAVYDHTLGCSITGGHVYRGSQFGALQGIYLYGDYCSGRMWGLVHNADDTWSSRLLATGTYWNTSFGEDEAGDLYWADHGNGIVYRIQSGTMLITGNAGVGGAVLSYANGSPMSVTADSSGYYAIPVPNGWSGTVTPFKTGYSFAPTSTSYTNVTTDMPLQDYSAVRRTTADFDRDAATEIAYFRAASGVWGILPSSTGFSYGSAQWFGWGQAGDLAVPGDYDGDGKSDPTIRRPPASGQSAAYRILRSSTNYSYGQTLTVPAGWPNLGDTPVPADYNGDGRTDPAIFRASTNVWIIPLSPNYNSYRFARWGAAGDVPVGADVDGDGTSDIGYFHPATGTWGFLQSSHSFSYGNPIFFSWGGSTDAPVMADYDGDGKADPAYVTPPAGGQGAAYRILLSSTGYAYGQSLTLTAGWPGLGDRPVYGDYDGDGKADAGVWRSSTGVWMILKSSTGNASYLFKTWGVDGDQVIQ